MHSYRDRARVQLDACTATDEQRARYPAFEKKNVAAAAVVADAFDKWPAGGGGQPNARTSLRAAERTSVRRAQTRGETMVADKDSEAEKAASEEAKERARNRAAAGERS